MEEILPALVLLSEVGDSGSVEMEEKVGVEMVEKSGAHRSNTLIVALGYIVLDGLCVFAALGAEKTAELDPLPKGIAVIWSACCKPI